MTRKVYEFTKRYMESCKQKLPEKPVKMSPADVGSISQMVRDELRELEIADTIVDQADALADIIYCVLDAAVRTGINLDPVLSIVHDANMEKVKSMPTIKDGKVQKPGAWQPPEPKIKDVIRYQAIHGSFPSTEERRSAIDGINWTQLIEDAFLENEGAVSYKSIADYLKGELRGMI
jgi:hypothetical protein